MAATIPDAVSVQHAVAILDSDAPPVETAIRTSLASPALSTDLDHWQLWTLVCLCRHINRQKWVGYVVETRLKGELAKLGRAGSLGHPEDMPQEGDVPDEPGWRYFFHGRGCCLSNKADGTSIDVDFSDEGASDRIDRFFYSSFLEELKQPEFPERVLQRKSPLQHAWQANIEDLVVAGCISVEHGIGITPFGTELFDAIEPLLGCMSRLSDAESASAQQKLLYAALSLGDAVLGEQIANHAAIAGNLSADIVSVAEATKQQRAVSLIESLRSNSTKADSSLLTALADLGRNFAKLTVEECLLRTPVDGIANTALAILIHWDDADLPATLEKLVERRYAEASGIRSLASAFLGGDSGRDKQPRERQVVHAVIGLLHRSRPEMLKPALRNKILSLLESASGATSGEAALLLFAFDEERGLNQLRKALSGTVPAAHSDSAAACVMLGTREAEQILSEALTNPNLQIQHTAVCALNRFPSATARTSAAHWSARLDGIDSPEGKEVSIEGRTITAYSLDDISHVNMDAFFTLALERLRKDFGPILSRTS